MYGKRKSLWKICQTVSFNFFPFVFVSGLSSSVKILTSCSTWSRLKTARTSTTPSSPVTRASPTPILSSIRKPNVLPHPHPGRRSEAHPISCSSSDSPLADQRPDRPVVPLRAVSSEAWGTDSPSSSRQQRFFSHQSRLRDNKKNSKILSNYLFF